MKIGFLRKIFATMAMSLVVSSCSGANTGNDVVAFPDSINIDQVVATVNSAPVTGRNIASFSIAYQPQTVDSLYSRMYNLEILDGYIDRILLYQNARAEGMTVTDSTTDWFVAKLYEAMGRHNFNVALQKMNLEQADVRSTIRLDLIVRRFIETVVALQVDVTDEIARTWYDQNASIYAAHDSVHARHILILAGDNMIQRTEVINGLRARALAGEDFAALARQYSEGPSGPRGGDLGYFTHRDMVAEFSDIAFALEPGEISEVFQTSFGFHVVQVLDRKSSKQVSFEEARPDILAFLRDQELNNVVQNRLLRARETAIIDLKFDTGGLTQRESATFTR